MTTMYDGFSAFRRHDRWQRTSFDCRARGRLHSSVDALFVHQFWGTDFRISSIGLGTMDSIGAQTLLLMALAPRQAAAQNQRQGAYCVFWLSTIHLDAVRGLRTFIPGNERTVRTLPPQTRGGPGGETS